MHRIKSIFAVILLVSFQVDVSASQQNGARHRSLSLDSGLDLLQQHQGLDDKPVRIGFKPEIVNEQTEFAYPHLEEGFQLLRKGNFQDFMRNKLMGKDLSILEKDGLGNYETALHNAMNSAERVVVSSCKNYFRDYLLHSVAQNVDAADLDDPVIAYIQKYQHVMNGFNQSIYSWPLFVQGFTAIDANFKESMQGIMGQDFFLTQNGNLTTINPKFKSALLAAQLFILDGVVDGYLKEFEHIMDYNWDPHLIHSSQYRYAMKNRKINFIGSSLLRGAVTTQRASCCVESLLNAGADMTMVDSDGKTVLDYAESLLKRNQSSSQLKKICCLLEKAEQEKILKNNVHAKRQAESNSDVPHKKMKHTK